MKIRTFVWLLANLVILFAARAQGPRYPAYPLITHDPYFSVWSTADRLTDRETSHWTGKRQSLTGLVSIDGVNYRFMGAQPSEVAPMRQQKVEVTPTLTRYSFSAGKVSLDCSFLSPLLVSDLDLFSRPITYIRFDCRSLDGRPHRVSIYFSASGQLALDKEDQYLAGAKRVAAGLQVLDLGSVDQQILNRSGDDLRIDWGYAYLAGQDGQVEQSALGAAENLQESFLKSQSLPTGGDSLTPQQFSKDRPAMALQFRELQTGAATTSRWCMVGYDDIRSLRYLNGDLSAWWRRKGMTMQEAFQVAVKDYSSIQARSRAFDQELSADARRAGGEKYAAICALAYRQSMAAHKLVADPAGQPLFMPKENYSNGCIATVDVIYPASPLLLLLSPALTKAMLQPIFAYAASPRWRFPFAPHDLGTYPYATGQVYGGGEKDETDQMPVEETANMIIMTAALLKAGGEKSFAAANWPVLQKWAAFLESKGFDPDKQLCTDDFAGHLAHNVNLSGKAIVALGAYAQLCKSLGKEEEGRRVRQLAETMVGNWIRQAGDGDHFRLAFDKPGTWSQKYNLVWDKVLGLHLFPAAVFEKEIAYYKKQQTTYGLPLDNRERYTKNDWITWTASMAGSLQDFRLLFDPVYGFAVATPQRVPLSDWYIADNAYQVGFQARSVVGGYFMRMLLDGAVWKKWFSRGEGATGPWAPIP